MLWSVGARDGVVRSKKDIPKGHGLVVFVGDLRDPIQKHCDGSLCGPFNRDGIGLGRVDGAMRLLHSVFDTLLKSRGAGEKLEAVVVGRARSNIEESGLRVRVVGSPGRTMRGLIHIDDMLLVVVVLIAIRIRIPVGYFYRKRARAQALAHVPPDLMGSLPASTGEGATILIAGRRAR